jgi:two-component system chemotaxis sensor kinase CheA
MVEMTDKAREEFFSEAQEIVEAFSRNLLSLDASQKKGHPDPDLINEAFRAVHTLKGLAGLFGASRLGSLSHKLEDLLDALRLGRAELSPEVLDVLFTSVSVFNRLLEAEQEGSPEPNAALRDLLEAIQNVASAGKKRESATASYDLDPGMLAVLTEYEEHRLRVNIENNVRLYKLRVCFDLASIDRELESTKDRAREFGEIITYLPTGEASSADSIELDLLIASPADYATVAEALAGDNAHLEEIPRRAHSLTNRVDPLTPAGTEVTRERSAHPVPDEEHAIDRTGSLRSITQTVRVDIRKLDHLMNVVGELSIVSNTLARLSERLRGGEGNRQAAMELHRLQRNYARRLTEIQDGILEMRMVPLGQVFERLARAVRQISRELGKEIRLVITGAETEIDKLIVEELSDPLMHMIRNAIDHGIEPVEEREAVGKPAAGTIALNAYQKGNHVMIEVEDDGRGIDEAALVRRAVAFGALDKNAAAELSRDEVLSLVFLPGVSTRQEVGDLSGRGVGMDVVKTNISKLGGVIDLQSEAGIGTKVTITLPITLAIVRSLLVQCGAQVFAVPLSTVSEALSFDSSGVRQVDGRDVMTLRGSTLPLTRLSDLLRMPGVDRNPQREFVVVTSMGDRRLGLIVDHLVGQQDIVIKALGPSLASVRGFAGASELGDQRVGLVLDTAAIIEEVLSAGDVRRQEVSHG